MILGIHVSTAGGIELAVERASDIGCNAFQLFISNPRSWKATPIDKPQIDLFRASYKQNKILNAVGHSIYLINLATENPYNLSQSISSLLGNLATSDRLGLSGLVTHIGSYKNQTKQEGIKKVISSIFDILNDGQSTDSKLILENTAGAGHLIGDHFEDIGSIMTAVGSERLAFCLDTAHAFESGYPLNSKQGLDLAVAEIDRFIGLDRLTVVHLNDSMTVFKSKRDRHQDFGEGEIGKEGMVRIINHPALKNKTFIMETPNLKSGMIGRAYIDRIKSYQK